MHGMYVASFQFYWTATKDELMELMLRMQFSDHMHLDLHARFDPLLLFLCRNVCKAQHNNWSQNTCMTFD